GAGLALLAETETGALTPGVSQQIESLAPMLPLHQPCVSGHVICGLATACMGGFRAQLVAGRQAELRVHASEVCKAVHVFVPDVGDTSLHAPLHQPHPHATPGSEMFLTGTPCFILGDHENRVEVEIAAGDGLPEEQRTVV